VAKQWSTLMRYNDLRASMAKCTGTALISTKGGRKACFIQLWIEGPKGAP
jgi:hypothetical protein